MLPPSTSISELFLKNSICFEILSVWQISSESNLAIISCLALCIPKLRELTNPNFCGGFI